MIRSLLTGLGAAAVLAACTPTLPDSNPSPGMLRGDLSGELVRTGDGGPPEAKDGVCWASDVTPALIETVTEQVMVQPPDLAEDGSIRTPATFRTVTQQKIVRDRQQIWFRTPCPDTLTIDFVATLQRALKARGLFAQPLTGQMDAATRDAIRRYQAPRGIDSDQLSLGAARDLGLVATDRANL